MGATLTALLLVVTLPALAAPANPEQTIADIAAEEEAALTWIEARTAAYQAFLANEPTELEARAERDKAILEMYSRAFQTQMTVFWLVARHPGNAEVAAAGQETTSAVSAAAADESQAVQDIYEAYAAGLVELVTTTTLPPLPVLPSTTSTTLPGGLTTSTTLPTGSTTSTTVGDTTSSTTPRSTTVPDTAREEASTTSTSPSPAITGPATGTSDRPVREVLSTSELAMRLMGEQVVLGARGVGDAADGGREGGDLGLQVVRGLIRLSVPDAITRPLVDLTLLLRAVVAAFQSGMVTLAWPAGTLSASLLVYAMWRRLRRM